MRFLGPNDLTWKGDKLYRNGSRRPLVGIEPDSKYPDMWRVRLWDGSLSDMVSRVRAKDAATCIALREANAPLTSKLKGKDSPSGLAGRVKTATPMSDSPQAKINRRFTGRGMSTSPRPLHNSRSYKGVRRRGSAGADSRLYPRARTRTRA